MIHNGGGKNGESMDCIENGEVCGGDGGRKDIRMRQTSLPYVHIWLHRVCLYLMYNQRNKSFIPLCTMNQNKN